MSVLGAVGVVRERGVGLLQLQRVQLLAQLALAHLPAALLSVAAVWERVGSTIPCYYPTTLP